MSKHRDTTHAHTEKGPSLARGPAWIVGTVLTVFGLMFFFKVSGTPLSTAGFPDGAAAGDRWLGFEANAWTAWLTTAAGALLLFGAAQHLAAKAISLLVGLALGAAAVIALFDGEDVLGLAAANGLTALAWGVAAAILIVTALLPRLGRKDRHDHVETDRTRADHDHDRDRTVDTGDHRDHDHRDHDRSHAGAPVAAAAAAAAPHRDSRDSDSHDRDSHDRNLGTHATAQHDATAPASTERDAVAQDGAARESATHHADGTPIASSGGFRDERGDDVDGEEHQSANTIRFPSRDNRG